MKRVLLISFMMMIACLGVESSVAQTITSIPARIKDPGHYAVASGTYQVNPNYYPSPNVVDGIFVSTDTSVTGHASTNTKGINDVSINGSGALIRGNAKEKKPGALTDDSFGVWFKNRTTPQDTTYRDAITNLMVRNFQYGIVFRLIADGEISNCTVDSTERGIQFATGGHNTRNVIKDNVLNDNLKAGIQVRGNYNLFENNIITNTYGSATEGGGIEFQGGTGFSHHNVLKNNRIDGALRGGLVFNGGTYRNGADGDQINNCNIGILFGTGKDSSNTIAHATLNADSIAIQAMGTGVRIANQRANIIQNTTISNSHKRDVDLSRGARLTLINVDFDSSKVMVADSSQLMVQYGLSIIVMTTGGIPAQGALVRVLDKTDNLVFEGVVDVTGKILADLTSYVQDASGKTYASYTVIATRGVDSDTLKNITVSKGASVQLTLKQTITSIPARIKDPGHYTVAPGTYQVNPNYYPSPNVVDGIFVSTDTSVTGHASTNTKGINDVSINGNGALIRGNAKEKKPGSLNDDSFGVWFKNRTTPQDTTYRDAVTDLMVRNFQYGIVFRLIADGEISNCTVDSTERGIQFATGGHNTRNVIKDNILKDNLKSGMQIRGNDNLFENNVITNTYGSTTEGGGIEFQGGATFSHHNVLKNNRIDGARRAGLVFAGGNYRNESEGDAISNCKVGILFNTGKDSSNIIRTATLTADTIAVQALGTTVSLAKRRANMIQNSTISGSITRDIDLSMGAALIVENVDFDSGKVFVADSSLLTVKYDLDIVVVNTMAQAVAGATVNVYEGAALIYTGTTDNTGHAVAILTSYMQSSGARIFSTYEVVASKGVDTNTVSDVSVFKGASVTLTLTQTITSIPARIKDPGHYTVAPGTYQVNPNYYPSPNVVDGIFVSTDTSVTGHASTNTKGINDVSINGSGALIRGNAKEKKPGSLNDDSFGVWFKNRTTPQDTTYRDAVTDLMVRNFQYGIVFRLIADGEISNCTVDSTERGIQFATGGHNTRNVIKDNILKDNLKSGMQIRGNYNLFENNVITNTYGSATEGGGIEFQGGTGFSHHNVLKNNRIDGARRAGLVFAGGNYRNESEGDAISNCKVGILFNTGKDSSNIIRTATLTADTIAVQALGTTVSLSKRRANMIQNSTISGSITRDIDLSMGAALIVENVDFDSGKVLVADSSLLTVKYDLDIGVVMDMGLPAVDATINVYDATTLVCMGTTDSTGHVIFALTSYSQSSVGKTFSRYTVIASKDALSDTVRNVTVFKDASVMLSLITTGIADRSISSATEQYNLNQNYPNPFNPETKIAYKLLENGHVSLRIYNVHGQLVRTLIDEPQTAGDKSVVWDAKDQLGNNVSSGIYFYVLKAGNVKLTKRMVLLR